MKICYVHNVIMPYKLTLLRALERIDGVSVVALGGRSHWPKSKFHRAIRRMDRPDVRSLATIDVLLPTGRGRQLHLFFSPGLPRALDRERPDLVIAGISNIVNNVLLLNWSRRRGTPYIWHGIGSVHGETTVLRRLVDPLIQRFVDNANGGWAFNTRGREYYTSRYGLPRNAVAVVPNIVDDEAIRRRTPPTRTGCARTRASGGLQVLFVGHLAPAKRVDRLIDAVRSLVARGYDVELTIVGDGPARGYLEGMVDAQVMDRILFMGAQFEDVGEFFNAADVFVLPGLGGLAIHRAMCHGLPVICSAADGSGEDMVENGRSGFLLRTDTPEEIATAIARLADNEALRGRMADRARRLVDTRFSIAALRDRVEQLLTDGVSPLSDTEDPDV